MQYSQEAYAEFGGQTECIMDNWKIENYRGGCKAGFRCIDITDVKLPTSE